ncbi:Beta-lactamase superfamily domain protein [compost metagenome]
MRWMLMVLVLMLMTAGCAQDLSQLGPIKLSDEHKLTQPKLEYFGVAGFRLRWRDEAVVFDPFFSRPSPLQLLWLTPDVKRINDGMPRTPEATMLLVGHAHYDHLLDVAWVLNHKTPNATFYGSRTAGHILRAEVSAEREFEDAEKKMAWLPGPKGPRPIAREDGWFKSKKGAFRAMPIQSSHAPNVTHIDLMGGSYQQDLKTLPKSFRNWKEGQTLAWLVDLLDENGKTVYRIHFQDSSSEEPYGFPPDPGDNRGIDVVILPVASWIQVKRYPQALIEATQPKLVVLCHWEDFFGGDPDDLKVLRGEKDEYALYRIVRTTLPQASQIVMPKPFSEIALPPL